MSELDRPGQPPQAQGAPAPVSVPAPPRPAGTAAWALGFLAYLPLPVLNLAIAGVVQLVVGLAQRKHGGIAARNGVRAANWGLTLLCWPVLTALALLVGALTGTPAPEGGIQFAPAGAALVVGMLGLYLLLCVAQMIYSIVGTLQSSRGRLVQLPVIPFLRSPRD